MLYDCMKKPIAEMSENELAITHDYNEQWYRNNCRLSYERAKYRNVMEGDIPDYVVNDALAEYHMPATSFDHVKQLLSELAEHERFRSKVHRWYFKNCCIGMSNRRFNLDEYNPQPEIIDCMMQELDLPPEQRDRATKELLKALDNDYDMWG